MAFKPMTKAAGGGNNNSDFDYSKLPTPKEGARPARISLIVDLGVQKREDFVDEKTGESRPQKPVQSVAIFADLPRDVVDYGGKIGEQPYRLALNGTFGGKFKPISFQPVPPKNDKGELIKGKPWSFPGNSVLTKLCKACGRPEVALDEGKYGLDLDQLLGLPFIANVEVKRTEKNDKTYVNVNFKGPSPVPNVPVFNAEGEETGEEKPMKVPDLKNPPVSIQFSSATVEQLRAAKLRGGIIKMIKEANNYAGSKMQEAIEAYEAELAAEREAGGEEPAEKPEPAKAAPKPAPKKVVKPKAEPQEEEEMEDAPF